MHALATPDDLVAYGFPVDDEALTNKLLASVSAAVREAAGAPISGATSTIDLAGTQEQFLPLPVGPVREVAAVTLDGSPIADFKIRDNRLWRASGWVGQHADVTVTYSHGLDQVPEDIVQLVCMFVGLGLNQAAAGELVRDRSMAYERIDDYQYGLRTGDEEVVDPTELPARVKASLRARFGGQAAVTGGF